jgi:hypothetical protein
MKRDDFEWAREKEPTAYRNREPARPHRTEKQRRAALALRYGGPCSVCHEYSCTCDEPVIPLTHASPLAAEVDANNQCTHAVREVLSRDGRTLENAVRRCVTCGADL